MDDHKTKEGVSIKEIENFTKTHRFEVFFCLTFVLAGFFSFFVWGAHWAMLAAIIGAIIGVLIPIKIHDLCKTILHFVSKQETTTQLVLAGIALVLAIVLPPFIFLLIGLHGGKDMHQMASDHIQKKH